MATVNVTVVYPTRTGATPVQVPAGVTPDLTGTLVPNDGSTYLVLPIGATVSQVTVPTNGGAGNVDGLATSGRVYTTSQLTANGTFIVGPFPINQYGSVLNPQFANVTTIKVGAFSTILPS